MPNIANTSAGKRAAFILMLRQGYVLSEDEIRDLYDIPDPYTFVDDVIKLTDLDIKTGKRRVKSELVTQPIQVYYLAEDISPEAPGLDAMQWAEEMVLADVVDPVEWQEGHYLMWVCPADLVSEKPKDGDSFSADMCGQFHKVDLGDEILTVARKVRCIKCGKEYQINPKGWK